MMKIKNNKNISNVHRVVALNKKKGQVEIVGLLIIVIMISIILLFALKSMFGQNKNTQSKYIQSTIASSFVGSMLNTNSLCTKDTNMEKVLIDCAKHPTTGGSTEFKCGDDGMKSCEFAGLIIEGMLNDTLKVWKRPYEFKVKSPEEGIIIENLHFIYTFKNEFEGSSLTILCVGGICEI